MQFLSNTFLSWIDQLRIEQANAKVTYCIIATAAKQSISTKFVMLCIYLSGIAFIFANYLLLRYFNPINHGVVSHTCELDCNIAVGI